MNRNILLSLIFIVPIMFLQACSQEQQAIEPIAEVPDAQGYQPQVTGLLATIPADDDPDSKTFQTLDGRGFDIELFEGEKVFVNFWATWCAPCIREIPSINRAAQALEAEGYTFIFASDEDTDTINDFLYEREFPGNFVKLNGYFATYGIGAVPSSWLADENGEVVTVWAGAFEWDSEEMLEEIRNPSSASPTPQ